MDLPDTVVCDHVHAGDGLERVCSGRVYGLSGRCVRSELPKIDISRCRATDLEVVEWVKIQNWHSATIVLQGGHQRVAVHSRLAFIKLIVAF